MRIKLTELSASRIKPPATGRLEVWDTMLPAFGLRVTATGAKSWVVAIRRPGKTHPSRIKIGAPDRMGLGDARTKAREVLANPSILTKATERQPDTVARMAAQYVERYLKRNTRRWRDAEQMLARDVLPKWGDRLATDITRRDVLELADGVLDRSPVSANRVLSLTRRLFNWAIERGIVESNPAAGLRPPHRERPRDRTLSEDEIRALWKAWTMMASPFGTIQKLLLLTAQRRGEVASMRWSDLDLGQGLWHLPGTSTKSGREHVVPMAPAVVDLLRAVPHIDAARVFPANRVRSDRTVSGFSRAKQQTDRLSGVAEWTWHDLRRSAITYMAGMNIPPHVCERILNHAGASTMSAIARVYNVHSYRDEMRRALDAWGREVERIIGREDAKVVALRSGTV